MTSADCPHAASRLGLGTAQFGLNYGITNRAGRPARPEVEAICHAAATAGFDLLDTASLYGEAETVIGGIEAARLFRFVTKTPKFADCGSSAEAAERLRIALAGSVGRLRRRPVDALLVHDADDLIGPNGDSLWGAMEAAREAGLVIKLGVSVYHGRQIDTVLARYPIEIVQIPFNPLDRRLIEGGQVERLAGAKVEIHARSLFLQGLLLEAPEAISPRFGALRDAVAELHDWTAARGLSPLQGVLAIVLAEPRIDRFIVGLASAAELEDIVSAAKCAQSVQAGMDFVGCAALDPRHLDPSRWAELG